MSSTDLPWRLRGRVLRPFAFAVSLATAIVAWNVLTGVAVGQLLDEAPGHLVGAAAVAGTALLWGAWWGRSDRLMTLGLLWTTGVWVSVGTVIALDLGPLAPSALLAGCWAVASGGAWLLEVTHPRQPTDST